jgi:hypothetical protein
MNTTSTNMPVPAPLPAVADSCAVPARYELTEPSGSKNQDAQFQLKSTQISLLVILAVACALFAIDFIFRTSHVSIDGVRYFSVFDDGMISMRYARNLVAHHGLVWNPGQRVEGFSNPLWTLLMAAVIGLFGPHFAPLAIQVIGGVLCFLIFGVLFRTAAKNQSSSLGLMFGFVLLAFSYPLWYWALAGMEAVGVALCCAIALSAHLSYESGNAGNPVLLQACLICVAYGLRPDGWLAIAPFFAASLLNSLEHKKYRRSAIAVVLIAAVMGACLLSLKIYYGEWVPNTYVLKVEGYSLTLRLRNGLAFLRQFWAENFILLAFIALAALGKRKTGRVAFLSACVVIGYQIYVGGDPWLYWRQLLPVYVLGAFSILAVFEDLEHLCSARHTDADNSGARSVAAIMVMTAIVLSAYGLFAARNWSGAWRHMFPSSILALAVLLLAVECLDRLCPADTERSGLSLRNRLLTAALIVGPIFLFAWQHAGAGLWTDWRKFLPLLLVTVLSFTLVFVFVGRLPSGREGGPPLSIRAIIAVAALGSFAVIAFEYFSYMGGVPLPYWERIPPFLIGAVFAASMLLYYGPGRWRAGGARLLLTYGIQWCLWGLVICAVLLGNSRFLPEIEGTPSFFSQQGRYIDKAILSARLIGPNKTHHVIYAGTYPYYVDGEMIDALGKSDKTVAKYPVDQAVAWGGMKGVPGHAKYDLRDTILHRQPDVIVDYAAWGRQDVTADISASYSLIRSDGVSLCVRNDLAEKLQNFVVGKCPCDFN